MGLHLASAPAPRSPGRTGLDAFTLKLIAMGCMLFDHVRTYIAYDILPEWTSLIPRFVAPLFVFFLVEGFFHTRSKRAYALRLYIGAAITMIGNIAINFAFGSVDPITGEMTPYSLIQGHNIFLTLALFLSILCLIERVRDRESSVAIRIGAACGAPCLCVLSLMCEGGIYLLPVLGCFYFLHERRGLACTGVAAWCAILFANALLSWLSGATGISLMSTLCFDSEWMMIAVIPLILLYNGQRGRNTPAAKNLFYWFYPTHLWVLMIVSYIFGR